MPTSPSACVSACISAAAALSSEDVKGPACISRSSEGVKSPLERRAWAPVDEGIAVLVAIASEPEREELPWDYFMGQVELGLVVLPGTLVSQGALCTRRYKVTMGGGGINRRKRYFGPQFLRI